MRIKDTYGKEIRALFYKWNAEIGKLIAKADKAETIAHAEYCRQIIEDLQSKQEVTREKLKGLKKTAEDAWRAAEDARENLKAGIEEAWNSLEEAVKSANSRLK